MNQQEILNNIFQKKFLLTYSKKNGEILFINYTNQNEGIFLYKMYQFNKTSSMIWGEIDGKKTVLEISNVISLKFGISEKLALKDCVEFINKLQSYELIFKISCEEE